MDTLTPFQADSEIEHLKARIRARRMRQAGTYLVEIHRPERTTQHEISARRFRAFEEQLRGRGNISGHWKRQGLDLYLW